MKNITTQLLLISIVFLVGCAKKQQYKGKPSSYFSSFVKEIEGEYADELLLMQGHEREDILNDDQLITLKSIIKKKQDRYDKTTSFWKRLVSPQLNNFAYLRYEKVIFDTIQTLYDMLRSDECVLEDALRQKMDMLLHMLITITCYVRTLKEYEREKLFHAISTSVIIA